MVTLVTPSVQIFSSCANFLVLHAIFCTSLRIFAQVCCVFDHFCQILHIFAKFCKILLLFAHLCVFLHTFFVLIFQAKKLCLCYFSCIFQLCSHTVNLTVHTVHSYVVCRLRTPAWLSPSLSSLQLWWVVRPLCSHAFVGHMSWTLHELQLLLIIFHKNYLYTRNSRRFRI